MTGRSSPATSPANDTRQLPVDISEWNLGDSDNGTGFNQTVGHALVYADMIGAFAQSGVAEEDYFDLHGGKRTVCCTAPVRLVPLTPRPRPTTQPPCGAIWAPTSSR